MFISLRPQYRPNAFILFEAYVDLKPMLISMPTTQPYIQLVRNLKRLSKPFKKVQKALKPGAYQMECTSIVMTIGSHLKLSHTESIRIFLHDELVKEVNNQKLLDVIIDRTLP